MPLSFVTPTETPYCNCLLYGAPKTSKSTGAASAPGPVLFLNLDLPNATRFAHTRQPELMEVEFEGMQTLVEVYTGLQQEAESDDPTFKTVVVDPLGELHRRLLDEASNGAIRPTLQQYGDVTTQIERFCRGLCELPINVVFVAHETPVKDEASGQIERLPWTGTNNPALGQKLMGMVDIVGYTGVSQTDDGVKYLAQLINAGGRRGGDRFAVLGEVRELDLSEWFRTIAGSPPNDASNGAQPSGEKETAAA